MTTTTASMPKPIAEALAVRIAGGQLELPLLPEATQDVLQLTFDENADGRALAELIHRDQSLAGHVLKLANSPLYAPKEPIVSLQQAVSRLGIAKIREITLVILGDARQFTVFGWDDWLRKQFDLGLCVGLYAQRVAKARRWNGEEAFLCGLLHGIGRPVVLQTIADIEEQLGLESPRAATERTIENIHHRVGGTLLESWKLPVRISGTVANQNKPAEAFEVAQTAMTTNLAIDLARRAMGARTSVPDLEQHPMLWPLNCYPDEIAGHLEAADEVLEKVRAMAGAL